MPEHEYRCRMTFLGRLSLGPVIAPVGLMLTTIAR
jgi:hypothetical protein